MKIDIQTIPVMTIEEFADLHGLTMKVREREEPIGHPDRFYAKFQNVEVKNDIFLRSIFGSGSTPEEAIEDYAKLLELKQIVVDAFSKKRREITAPRFK